MTRSRRKQQKRINPIGCLLIIIGLALLCACVFIGIRTWNQLFGDSSSREILAQDTEKIPLTTESLTKNQETILSFMENYYRAKTERDMETWRKLDPSIVDEKETEYLDSNGIEGYQNLITYSLEAPETGSYLVYSYYEGKVSGIDTPIPSLAQIYLKTGEDGNLYIADTSDDEAATAFIAQSRASEEVQNLITLVSDASSQAQTSDEKLQAFMEQYNSQASETEQTETESTMGTENAEDPQTSGVRNAVVTAEDALNIRAEASATSHVLGTVSSGDLVTLLNGIGDEWTAIEYGGITAYVVSEFLELTDTP